jgi:MFS family permease
VAAGFLTRDRTAYGILLAVGVVDSVGYGIIGPIVPTIADETGAGPAVMGALVAMFGIGMIVGFALAGRAIQRTSAITIVAVSLALSAIAAAVFLLPPNLALYFAARFLMGLGAGGLWLGGAFAIMERWPGSEYRRLSGLMAVYSAGAIAGPALAGVGGIRGPFLLYIGLVVICGVLLPLVGPPNVHAPAFSSDRTVLREPGFAVSTAAITLVAVTIATFDGVLPLHFDDLLGQRGIAALYACAGIVIALATVYAARLAMRPVVISGTVMIIVGLTLAGVTGELWWWGVAVVVAATGFGFNQTGSLGYLLDAVGPDRMILAMVVWSQVFSIGYLVGPILGGLVAETLGYAALGLVPLVFGLLVFAALARMPRPAPVSSPG